VKRTYRRLTLADRKTIATRLTGSVPVYDIAAELEVTPPTVYREIRRGLTGERDALGRIIYDPNRAEDRAAQNRQHSARKPRQIIARTEDTN
jgi:IS30 family transposase